VNRLANAPDCFQMHGLTDMTGFLTKPDFNADGIHPTNDGYKKMAAVWTAAILEAREAGMLQDPEDNGQDDDVPMVN
jgi:lysophospholipase L1-like esterase